MPPPRWRRKGNEMSEFTRSKLSICGETAIFNAADNVVADFDFAPENEPLDACVGNARLFLAAQEAAVEAERAGFDGIKVVRAATEMVSLMENALNYIVEPEPSPDVMPITPRRRAGFYELMREFLSRLRKPEKGEGDE